MRRAAKLDRYYDFNLTRRDFEDVVGNAHVVERQWVVTLTRRQYQERQITAASKYLRLAFEGCVNAAEKRVAARSSPTLRLAR